METPLGQRFNVSDDESDITTAATKSAQGILHIVHKQLTAAATSAMQHLRRSPEAWEIGSRAHDIESALEKFERGHDDSIRSFYAYISAPSSSDLLREHGIVWFDESGEQAVQPESIQARKCRGWVTISRSADTCKDRLKLVRREELEAPSPPSDDEGTWTIEESVFDDEYRNQVVSRVNTVCRQRVEAFVSELSQRVGAFVEDVDEERTRVASSRSQIWRARATLVGRSALVAIALSVLLLGFARAAPNQFESLLSMLSEGLLEMVLAGSLSTVFVLVLAAVITGAKNEVVRQALRPCSVREMDTAHEAPTAGRCTQGVL